MLQLFRKKQKPFKSPRRRLDDDRQVTDSGHVEQQPFRRNRTIVGSRSSDIATVGESRAAMQSSRTKLHNLHARRQLYVISLFCIVIMLVGCYILVSKFIGGITVSSKEYSLAIDKSYYKNIIVSFLNDHPGQRFLGVDGLDKARLESYLLDRSPEIERVVFTKPSLVGSVDASIVFRKPLAVWKVGSKAVYVDKSGVTFSKNHYQTPEILVTDRNPDVTQEVNVPIASNRFISFIGRVIYYVERSGKEVSTIDIPLGTSRQIAVGIRGVDYVAKMSTDRPVGEQTEDMLRAIKYISKKKIKAKYIDVRVSGRAYYKL